MATAPFPPAIGLIAQPTTPLIGKHLIVQLGGEQFAINVLRVKEIVKIQAITSVPQTPSFIQGVINLRGKIVPVISLRRRLDLEDSEDTELTCIVVVRMQGPGGEHPIGIVVDAVIEVLNIAQEEIEDAPDFGLRGPMLYVKGLAKIRGTVKIVLDLDQVLHCNDI